MTTATNTPRTLRDLAGIAMLGTDRSGAMSPRDVLAAAAVLGTRTRAGRRAGRGGRSLPECPPETLPAASDRAGATLHSLVSAADAGLIQEWAELALSAGMRAPDAVVPMLLDWWARQPRRSEAVFAVTASRGRWLASLNPDWDKPVAGSTIPPDADERWQTGKAPERAALLMTVRRVDPARGLSMVEAVWATEGADERRRFVEALRDGLSMADEPFLEAALDDKAKTVRRSAADLLAELPGSRLRARMAERARSIIVVERARSGLLRREKVALSLEPPKECTPEMERDGIENEQAMAGKRAWWMRRVLESTDLSVWTEHTGMEPAAIVEAIAKDDHAGEALTALKLAVGRAGAAEWVVPLARAILSHADMKRHDVTSMWARLPADRRAAIVLEVAGHQSLHPTARWQMLVQADERWSPDFSVRALHFLQTLPPPRSAELWQYEGFADRLARLVWPAAEAAVKQLLSGVSPGEPAGVFQKALDTVRLRAQIHQELNPVFPKERSA